MSNVDDSSSDEEPPALADASGVLPLHCHTGVHVRACMRYLNWTALDVAHLTRMMSLGCPPPFRPSV